MEKLSIDDKIALSDYRYEKAMETLKDGKIAFENKSYKMAANRAYYAVLHGIRALLILKGLDPVTHDGAKTMFSLHFIKPKILSADTLKNFNTLLLLRKDVDYGDFEKIDEQDAQGALKIAEKFLKIIKSVRVKLISELKEKL